jgi:hypothetical protein
MHRTALGLIPAAIAAAIGLAAPGSRALAQDRPVEIGSDRHTGGPTQQDRDTMRDIQERMRQLKERRQR